MASLSLGHLPSLWKQHLLSEFAGLKQACPEGVFVSLNPGDPSLWSAVLFVRNGPYAPAVLRFHITFPDSYPRVAPLVTFQTDMFHPLITPLTTHMYSTDLQDDGSGGAAEQERLPPGGFSLRHGFPEWYKRDKRTANGGSKVSNAEAQGASSLDQTGQPQPGQVNATPTSPSQGSLPRYMQTSKRTVSTYSILKYIRSTFDKEDVLDSVPLSAAGNPGAWHAWRTHRRKQGKVFQEDRGGVIGDGGSDGSSKESEEEPQPPGEENSADATSKKSVSVRSMSPSTSPTTSTSMSISMSTPTSTTTTRRPGEWNWDGVWEDRVKKGIASTLSESVLYGAAGGPESLIHFLALEDGDIQTAKDNLRRTLVISACLPVRSHGLRAKSKKKLRPRKSRLSLRQEKKHSIHRPTYAASSWDELKFLSPHREKSGTAEISPISLPAPGLERDKPSPLRIIKQCKNYSRPLAKGWNTSMNAEVGVEKGSPPCSRDDYIPLKVMKKRASKVFRDVPPDENEVPS
ncbi:Protein crossbronx-like protein [Cladobotryum mycophilum]|uniref:Protein crossbronx-like protein n=1 Tax=Cladobotryum mycophilum TaxID=491253 RepID=A0ABR0T245_9HYPO